MVVVTDNLCPDALYIQTSNFINVLKCYYIKGSKCFLSGDEANPIPCKWHQPNNCKARSMKNKKGMEFIHGRMRGEIDTVEIIKQVIGMWKKDLNRYILPSLEILLLTYITMFGLVGFIIILQFVPLIPLILIIEYEMYYLIPLTIILFSLILILFLAVSVLINSIIMGGTSTIVRRLMRRGDYEFFDILREGWKRKWTHIRIFLATMAIHILIILSIQLIIGLALTPFILLAMENGLFIFIVVPIGLAGFIFFLLMSVFLLPFHYCSFTYHRLKRTEGLRSATGALRFMRRNKKATFILGGGMYIVQFISSNFKFLGLLIGAVMPIFYFQCVNLMMDRKKSRKATSRK